MSEKKVSEADKAELRDVAVRIAAPCPFKVGDIVMLREGVAVERYMGIKHGQAAIVVAVQTRPTENDKCWEGLRGGDIYIAFKLRELDAVRETVTDVWADMPTNSWKFRLA